MALKTISGNWSSRHLVSCRATTSTSLRSSQAATRSARERMELTFQVAIRTTTLSDYRPTPRPGTPRPALSRTCRSSGTLRAPLVAPSHLDGDLVLGGHAGAH